MPKSHNRLGKGLSALISPGSAWSPERADDLRTPNHESAGPEIKPIHIDNIKANPKQPRTRFDDAELNELAESIRSNGVLQPILVRPATDGTFELIAGERRLRASRLAGLRTIPTIVKPMTDEASLEISLIENLQREDLSPLERSTAYQQFIDTFGVSVEQLARRLSQSRASVANYLRLLKLSDSIRIMIDAGQLGMGHARAIAGINDPQRQLALARKAIRRNLSVRQVEALASSEGKPEPNPIPERVGATAHLESVARELTRVTGLKVTLHPGKRKNSGRVVLRYTNLDEFDQLARKLGAKLPAE